MKKLFFLVLFLFLSGACVIAQIPEGGGPPSENEDEGGPGGGLSRKFSEKKEKQKRAPIDLYKIISVERDTTYLDTTLNIQKEYKFNYLRRDDFELQPELNIGRPYTQLAKQISSFDVIPQFGATVRHLGYLEIEDINYYQVPTPLTCLLYTSPSPRDRG